MVPHPAVGLTPSATARSRRPTVAARGLPDGVEIRRVSRASRGMSNMTGLVVAVDLIVVVVLVSFVTGEHFVPVTPMVVAPLAASAYA